MFRENESAIVFSEVKQDTDPAPVAPQPAPAGPSNPARILDGVRDQHGMFWIRYGTATRCSWFSLAELQTREKDVFSRLSGPGMTFLTNRARNVFKEEIEAHAEYRPALVAAHPGWLGGHFIFGDGTVVAPPGDTREVIIAFHGNTKFTPQGTLTGWQDGVGPVVTGQALPLFALAYAFAAPLLRFAPSYVLNPQVELVGEPECGKSSLGALAASVWAGDPSSDVAGGETWDLTINTLDPQKLVHADILAFRDEGNLAGTSAQDRRELMRKAVFTGATTGGRKRYTDTVALPNVRGALLSTSNMPLRELVKARGPEGRRAHQNGGGHAT